MVVQYYHNCPQPPFTQGGHYMCISHANKSSSPFAKAARHELAECGDRGGFGCAFASYLTSTF